jgi:glycosyltransferase involved in cell wall biosynthesis
MNEKRSRKPRILHITFWYPTRENPTSGSFVKDHIQAVSKFTESKVIAFSYLPKDSNKLLQFETLKENGVEVFFIKFREHPSFKINFLVFAFFTFFKFLRILFWGFRPDIINSHIYIATIVATRIGRLLKIPVVATEHFSRLSLKRLMPLERKLAISAFNRCSLVCPVSKRLKKDLIELGVKARIEVIPNAVNTQIFYPPENKELDPKKPKLLFVGGLTREKGLYELFDALFELRNEIDFSLDILGDGPERKNLEEYARKLGISDRISFFGRQPKEVVAEKMREASFLVHPSHFETFGCVVAEALCCSTPVLATNIGALPEIVNDERLGILVEPHNNSALISGLKQMFKKLINFDPRHISETASKRYSFETIGKKYFEAYSRVLEKN